MNLFTRLLTSLLFLTPLLLAAQETKPYKLFIGVDLLVKQPDTILTVASLKPHEAIVGREPVQAIPLTDIPSFTWTRTPKVGRATVKIEDLKSHRSSTIQQDLAIKWMTEQARMAIYQQEKAAAEEMVYYESERLGTSPTPFLGPSKAKLLGFGTAEDVLLKDLDPREVMAYHKHQMDVLTDSTFHADRTQDGIVHPEATVLELEFLLSSDEPIADAYVVIMGNLVSPGAKTKDGVAVFHRNIGAIGPDPRRIKVRQIGFEPGFTLNDVVVHVYSHGKELATNLSERVVPLSRDEAREYLLLAHIADHATESLPPSPVWQLAPTALLANRSAERFDHPVILTIDADGSVISIHESETDARAYLAEIHDAAVLRAKNTPDRSLAASVRLTTGERDVAFDQTGRLPPAVVAALREMVFLPALDLGTPVSGITKVNLADFFL